MKKVKKLTLNKEVVSILAGNEMNLMKGGAYSDYPCGGGSDYTACDCGGAPAPIQASNAVINTCQGSCGQTCVVENSCVACPYTEYASCLPNKNCL